jgi:hypothetical protein
MPRKETQIDVRLKRISPVCQDLMTDPYPTLMIETSNGDVDLIGAFIVTILIWLTSALTR